jgi:hypothetical protein
MSAVPIKAPAADLAPPPEAVAAAVATAAASQKTALDGVGVRPAKRVSGR